MSEVFDATADLAEPAFDEIAAPVESAADFTAPAAVVAALPTDVAADETIPAALSFAAFAEAASESAAFEADLLHAVSAMALSTRIAIFIEVLREQ